MNNNLYAHCECASIDLRENTAELQRFNEGARQENEQLRAERDVLRAFVERVSKQRPEKPDYWCSCGQCEHNIDDAKELLSHV